MGKASKDKGGDFEREINRKLSLWLTHGERHDVLIRNVSSGAAYTMAARRNQKSGVPGDAIAVHPMAFRFQEKFFLEYKHWRSLDLESALFGKGEFFRVIQRMEELARKARRHYFIVAQQNYRPTLILVEHSLAMNCIRHWLPSRYHHSLWNNRVFMARLNEFMQINPESFLEQAPPFPRIEPRHKKIKDLEVRAP